VGQSPFAIGPGVTFERALYAAITTSTRSAIYSHGGGVEPERSGVACPRDRSLA
jgi:hypothetical protein